MSLFKKIFGRLSSRTGGAASVPFSEETASGKMNSPKSTNARDWLAKASEQTFFWSDLGDLELPSQGLFVGDPTGGHDHHMRNTSALNADRLRVWCFESGPDDTPEFMPHTNTLVWMELLGTVPVARGKQLGFSVDAACIGLGDLETGHAFTRLSDIEFDAGRGDNFEWLLPYIQEKPHFARWVEIPPDSHRMFVASTGHDGGFAAVWLYDQNDQLSGILIDIGGRASDLKFLDTLLPQHVGEVLH